MNSSRGSQIREGKAKILFRTDHPDGYWIQYFKDDATAFNGEKKGTIRDKGILNNKITEWIFSALEEEGIPTHLVKRLNDREMLIKPVDVIPVEIVVRNKAAGSLCKRLGIEKKLPLDPPLVEYFYKSDPLGDPLISENHIFYFKWATEEELNEVTTQALRVNTFLRKLFSEIGLDLIDFKLEFGRYQSGEILLVDEFTPDGCRLWDLKTGEPMDKDRFRFEMGGVEDAYFEVYGRLEEYFTGHRPSHKPFEENRPSA